MKTNSNTLEMKFDFWKHNKKDEHFQLSASELKSKFLEWLPTKGKDWLEYYGTTGALMSFVGDANGLQSVHQSKQVYDMETLLRDAFWNYVQNKS